MSSRENLGLLLGAIGVTLFAGTVPATRYAVPYLDPFFLSAARATLAGLFALAVLLVLRRRIPRKETWAPLAIVSLGLILGFPLFSALGLVTVPAAHGGVVLGILPLATVAAAAVIAGERPSPGFWLAAVAGALIVTVFALRRGGAAELAVGDLFLLASIVAAAIGYTVSGRLALIMPGWEVISWALVFTLPLSLLATWLTWPAEIAAVPRGAWIALLYVALFSQWIGFFAWNAGLALGGIARVSQVQLLQTFVTLALAALVNDEAVDLETVLFACAVVVTVMIGRQMRIEKKS